MGDEQRRGAGVLQDRAHLVGQAFAQVDVEVGEGLVQQQQLRRRRQRARQRDALLLPARQLVRRTLRGMAQPDQIEHLLHPRGTFGSRQLMHAEGDVVGHAQVREQRVVLEHHADAARLGRQLQPARGIVQHLAGHQHLARL